MNFKKIWQLIRETFQDWSADKAPRLAAALSYYTVFSLAPLLVLIIAITGFIIGNNAAIRDQILTQVQSMAGGQARDMVNQLITNASQPRTGIVATVLGIATLLLGATGVFGQLKDALNTIWEVEPKKGGGIMAMIKDRFLSFTMVLGVSFLLLVSLVISTALSLVNHYFSSLLGNFGILAQILNFVISIGVVTLIFAMIFKILPDADIAWRDVWLGALVTALLFAIGKSLLGLYLGSSAASSTYGAAGSLVIILLWVYYSAQILFMGAEFTQVYARLSGSQIEPSANAQRIPEAARKNQGMTGARQTGERRKGASASGRQPQPTSLEQVQGAMIPISGQPAIHPAEQEPRERIRYTPPNPAAVVPVITLGAAAGVYTITRILRRLIP